MRRHRNVKIVATLGPKSDNYKTILKLFLAGADVFRLNMSHGDYESVCRKHGIIRQIEEETGRPIGILVDLQGPKLRVGPMRGGGAQLETGATFRFDLDAAPGDALRAQLPHPEIFESLEPGDTILMDDGKLRLSTINCGQRHADCRVMVGGMLTDRKGVNVPDTVPNLTALSDKDRKDLEFVCELGVDWLGLSFVQRPRDIEEGRRLAKGRSAVLAKIEKPAAIGDFERILEVSDGIMIARGDLGVELPVQNVPPIQKRLILQCRAAAKPVIVATQMLESMISSPSPTRAEVSDVAAAIYEGADAVMLSAESAVGQFPVESVRTMNDIAIEIEGDPIYRESIEASRKASRESVADAITAAAREIAETTNVKAICCYTHSGTTVALAARERARVPIIALTPFDGIARRFSLTWGAHCMKTGELSSFDRAVARAVRLAGSEGFGKKGDHVIITAGVPFNVSGTTNTLRVSEI